MSGRTPIEAGQDIGHHREEKVAAMAVIESDRSVAQVQITFGAKTHPGLVRSNNEDQFLVARLCKSMHVCKSSMMENDTRLRSEEVGHLFVVADGMGGAAAGEQASALAIEAVEDFALNTLKWFLHLEGSEENSLLADLRAGLERADKNLIDRARSDPKLRGMGTTLTMAYSVADDLYIVHAGDTRAYLFHEGELEQVTTDHTLVQLLVDHGGLSKTEAKTHHRRHVVTNVVGGPSRGVHAEVHKVRISDGDVLLLCSDGLSEPVGDPAIAEIFASHPDPEAACETLIGRAIANGGPDNVTAIVVKYQVR